MLVQVEEHTVHDDDDISKDLRLAMDKRNIMELWRKRPLKCRQPSLPTSKKCDWRRKKSLYEQEIV